MVKSLWAHNGIASFVRGGFLFFVPLIAFELGSKLQAVTPNWLLLHVHFASLSSSICITPFVALATSPLPPPNSLNLLSSIFALPTISRLRGLSTRVVACVPLFLVRDWIKFLCLKALPAKNYILRTALISASQLPIRLIERSIVMSDRHLSISEAIRLQWRLPARMLLSSWLQGMIGALVNRALDVHLFKLVNWRCKKLLQTRDDRAALFRLTAELAGVFLIPVGGVVAFTIFTISKKSA